MCSVVITSSLLEMVGGIFEEEGVTHSFVHPGQMFEGTPEVMLGSIKKMMLLPKNTLVFPGE